MYFSFWTFDSKTTLKRGKGEHSDNERCVFTFLSDEFCPGLSSDLDLERRPITSEKRPEEMLCVSRIMTVMHNMNASCYDCR